MCLVCDCVCVAQIGSFEVSTVECLREKCPKAEAKSAAKTGKFGAKKQSREKIQRKGGNLAPLWGYYLCVLCVLCVVLWYDSVCCVHSTLQVNIHAVMSARGPKVAVCICCYFVSEVSVQVKISRVGM